MSELLEAIAGKLEQVKLRVSLLTIVVVLVAVVFMDRRVSGWEATMGEQTKTLNHLDAACWHVDDMREFVHQVKEKNNTLALPDPVDIIRARQQMKDRP